MSDNTKKCNKCLIKKEYSCFWKSNVPNYKDGLQYTCIDCCKVREKENRWKYKGKYRDKQKISRKEWKTQNKEHLKQQQTEYRQKNKEKRNEYNRMWRKENSEHHKQVRRIRNEKNSDKIKLRRISDIKFNLDSRMSGSVRESLKENKRGRKWETLVGYELDDIKVHLESKFKPDMTWRDCLSGKIEIDHILPISLFEYSHPEDISFKICWSLDNLQPLWEWDNHKKSDFLSDGRRASNLTRDEKSIYLIKLGYNFEDGEGQICV